MPTFETIDGNEAVARVAYALNEVIAIYPITPATAMGEWADTWSSAGVRNLWGTVPAVAELQSEGGAAGALHGALQTGALATTFTASQGLLLMLPNLYKIAGELTPADFHIASRALAAQALSIFGDHSDVMAARTTGWSMLCSASVQEAHDFAVIAQAGTLATRIPCLHFFDGFRTSHELAKIEILPSAVLQQMIPETAIQEHRARGLSPDHPVVRGTAQNPDVYFQAREAVNPFYAVAAERIQARMDAFAALTGRSYQLYEYHGAPDARQVLIVMGSAGETARETAHWLNARGAAVGVLQVRLFRPFDPVRLAAALPTSVRAVAVLDRCKEPGSAGEPLYLDVVNALHECNRSLRIVGGRYGLASKEFTPAMAKAVFDELSQTNPRNHFTIGIQDDLSHTSLAYNEAFDLESDDTFRAVFYGLGSDGTVGANKESIKIIGECTDNYAQGYFVYDSKKSGAVTVSHLRFGPHPIRAPYLITQAHFIGCHQPLFLERFDVAKVLRPGGILLLNSPHGPEQVWQHLPQSVQSGLIQNQARLYVIDATRVARECGMGGRINIVMQVCFFSVSGVLPHDEAIDAIRDSIRKAYGRKGEEIVRMNLATVERTQKNLHEVRLPSTAGAAATPPIPPPPTTGADYVRDVLPWLLRGQGDALPTSALPCDGTFPSGTARLEKRNLATDIPVWDPDVCIQCGRCVLVCPHAAIRAKAYAPDLLAESPITFKSHDARLPEWKGQKYTLQVAPEDCTGCALCIDVCPARNKSAARLKAINLAPQAPLRDPERLNWEFFLRLPDPDRRQVNTGSVRGMQSLEPLFEFSGACAGCGETPYLKLLTQLFGDRLLVANATGCSSIYGGNLPTTPWSADRHGRGPAWSNSLFEDNAEFGLGFRVSLDKQREMAAEQLTALSPELGPPRVRQILENRQRDEAEIHEQREWVTELKHRLETLNTPAARQLLAVADTLVKRSVWIVGGDGWAYDIGYGGLEHVLASGRNVKILVLDTEVYSNTGGQTSKATPRGAVAKFAAGGKATPKKDLGLIAMTYGSVYVACVAMGAKDEHTLKVFLEAEAFDGPALIIAYSHCIAHGIEM